MQEWDGGGRREGVAEKLQYKYNNNIDIVDSRRVNNRNRITRITAFI